MRPLVVLGAMVVGIAEAATWDMLSGNSLKDFKGERTQFSELAFKA